MRTTLLALHGFTLNGHAMQSQLQGLAADLARHSELLYVDAPHVCDPESVDRLYASWSEARQAPPHLCWWDSNADGSVYEGLETTLALMRDLLERHAPVGLLGFSQGAILGAALAALSSRGELPRVDFAVLVAGRMPRALSLVPAFAEPIATPSLHVWGDRDSWVNELAPLLVERFDPSSREVHVWPGPHLIPTRGSGGAAIVDFVRRHSRP